MYRVKEAFYSIQGEGAQAGRPMVFCRFSGCNLWSGKVADKAGCSCPDCDTDFVGTDGAGGGEFDSPDRLARYLRGLWRGKGGTPWLLFTGGEPTLQLDAELIRDCTDRGFKMAIESNGTRPIPAGLDWICISPKQGTQLVATTGDELKLLYPYGLNPVDFESCDFTHFLLQPVDNPAYAANREAALAYCLEHPQWRLSLQIHKILKVR